MSRARLGGQLLFAVAIVVPSIIRFGVIVTLAIAVVAVVLLVGLCAVVWAIDQWKQRKLYRQWPLAGMAMARTPTDVRTGGWFLAGDHSIEWKRRLPTGLIADRTYTAQQIDQVVLTRSGLWKTAFWVRGVEGDWVRYILEKPVPTVRKILAATPPSYRVFDDATTWKWGR